MSSTGNILLIGMPGCGKSALGRQVARQAGLDFVDMDDWVQTLSGQSIPQLFAQGEEVFRDWETAACRDLAQRSDTIIAAGGGVVVRPQNIDYFRPRSTIIYINRPVEQIAQGIDRTSRPLLKEDAERLFVLYEQRRALYEQAADQTLFNTGTQQAAQEALLRMVRRAIKEEKE